MREVAPGHVILAGDDLPSDVQVQKEVVSVNTGGPAFIVTGALIVFVELGMVGITGSPGFLNKGGG
jgi:hypothetical protein